MDAATSNTIRELRSMLRVLAERLEQANSYKGDHAEEWADKEIDLYWVKRARPLLFEREEGGDGGGHG